MKELLNLMLVHYYQNSKRATNATITRALDNQIRLICSRHPELSTFVSASRKTAEAAKRQARTAESKSRKPHMHHGNPHVNYKPCRERRG